jgi:hypothetical protein
MEFSIDRSNWYATVRKFVWFVAKSVFSIQKSLLDDANPFILNDAVGKQRIKPSPPIVLEQQVIPIPQSKQNY